MSEDVLGVASCGHCNKRYRIRQNHARIIGKEIQCPQCHRPFVVKLLTPSPLETAAIEQAATSQEEQQKAEAERNGQPGRRRRKKAEIRGERYQKIRETMPAYMKRLKAISEQDSSSEEQIRIWCIDVLKSALEHLDADIDTELNALNQRIDIAVKHDGRVVMVIECKNIRSKLPTAVRDQAVMYAVNKSADWAVVTNGQVWKMYRVLPVKGKDPEVVEVFDIALLDEDGLSDYDVECLYLLTKRALLGTDSEREFHLRQSLDLRRVVAAIRDERTTKLLRKLLNDGYKRDNGVSPRLDDDVIAERITELFVPKEL